MKKLKWALLVVALVLCVTLWAQTLNAMCDQDVPFFSGICVVNKYIPW